MSPPLIRTARVADVPQLAGVHLASWLHAYRGVCSDEFLDSLTAETFEGYHRPRFNPAPDESQPFLVACDDDHRVIGFARAGPTRATSPTGDPIDCDLLQRYSAELYAIYVHPDCQSRGVGRKLFAATVERLSQLGHESLCLWVLRDNRRSRRFYERAGGLPAGESPITLAGIAYPQVAYAWKSLDLVKT